jgi:hypothetical protein
MPSKQWHQDLARASRPLSAKQKASLTTDDAFRLWAYQGWQLQGAERSLIEGVMKSNHPFNRCPRGGAGPIMGQIPYGDVGWGLVRGRRYAHIEPEALGNGDRANSLGSLQSEPNQPRPV